MGPANIHRVQASSLVLIVALGDTVRLLKQARQTLVNFAQLASLQQRKDLKDVTFTPPRPILALQNGVSRP